MNPYLKQFNLKINVARRQKLNRQWSFENTALHVNRSTYTRLYMPVAGEGFIEFRDVKIHLIQGNIYLIPSYVELNASCPEYLEKYWVHFNMNIFNSELDIFSVFKVNYELPVTDAAFCEKLFKKIIKHYYMPVIDRRLKVNFFESKLAEGALLLLLEPFLKTMEASVSGKREEALLRMVKVISYIEGNLNRPVKLKELAEQVNLNPTYLSNLFTSLVGVSPICYYNQQRVERAKQLLTNTNLRISEIAARSGSDSLDSFYKIFMRHTNMSPSEYREKIKTEE